MLLDRSTGIWPKEIGLVNFAKERAEEKWQRTATVYKVEIKASSL